MNPYESSKTPTAVCANDRETLHSTELLSEWERRRFWFNGILIAVTLLFGILPDQMIFEFRFWEFAVEGAIVANTAFCAGPVANWYLDGLGFRSRSTGIVLFWLGTSFAVVMTIGALFANFVPWQD